MKQYLSQQQSVQNQSEWNQKMREIANIPVAKNPNDITLVSMPSAIINNLNLGYKTLKNLPFAETKNVFVHGQNEVLRLQKILDKVSQQVDELRAAAHS
jgi:hypothetical protein